MFYCISENNFSLSTSPHLSIPLIIFKTELQFSTFKGVLYLVLILFIREKADSHGTEVNGRTRKIFFNLFNN